MSLRKFSPASASVQPIEGYQPIGPSAAGLTLLTVALWGGTPVAISFSVDTLPPVAVAGIRFVLAAVFMLFWCRLRGTPLKLKQGELLPSLVLGGLLFLQIAMFTVGIDQSNSSHGTLFINTFVFWVAAIEHFVTRTDRLSPARFLGLLLAAFGVLLILWTTKTPAETTLAAQAADAPDFVGDLLLLVSGVLLGIKVVYTKHAVKHVEPGKLIFWHDVFGVVLFAAYSALFESVAMTYFSLPAVLGLIYQGVVVAGFCFAVQAYLLKKHSASQLSVFSFATPLFGISLAVLFRGDPLSPWLFAAVGCVVAGIVIVNRTPRIIETQMRHPSDLKKYSD